MMRSCLEQAEDIEARDRPARQNQQAEQQRDHTGQHHPNPGRFPFHAEGQDDPHDAEATSDAPRTSEQQDLACRSMRPTSSDAELVRIDMRSTAAPATPCRDLRADRSCRDCVAKCERRGNGRNGLRALADALNGGSPCAREAAKNALVDIDALDFVELISKVRCLMKPVLWTTRTLVTSVSVVSGGTSRRPVQGRKPSDRRQGQANQHQRVGGDQAPQHQKCDRHDPRRDCRQKGHPVLVGRIQHPFAGLQISSI